MTDLTTDFAREILEGLTASQKSISSKWLYDDAGSALFEEITDLEEYYPTRTEAVIFENAFPETANIIGNSNAVIEFGSGASIKIRNLIETVKPEIYIPLDIAEDFMNDAVQQLSTLYPNVKMMPVVADLTQDMILPDIPNGMAQLGFFPGSTIGNFAPNNAIALLQRMGNALQSGAYLLISADLIKDHDRLVTAYDDAKGITAAFNLNLLKRINRELGADFDVTKFKHVALYNENDARIEMHLESLKEQHITIGTTQIGFKKSERIHTENSYKYTIDSFHALLQKSGWTPVQHWTDKESLFGVFLAHIS